MSEIKINSQGEVKLFDSDNSNYIGLKAPATVGSNETFILPDADGSANNALKTDGSGNLGFVDVTTLVTSAIDWQSTVKTGDFTAASGEGYFINTTSGAVTATLPASPSAGAIVAFKDYAATFATNNLTVGRNSSNIQGAAVNSTLSTNRASVVLVYVDATKGWLYVQESNVQNLGPQYVAASGGTETTSGDFKIHTFTGSGTFTVSCGGNASGSNTVDYLVIAGGGGGGGSGGNVGGGGGAGAYQVSATTYTGPSLASGISALPVSAQAYPVTIGSGGTGGGNGGGGPFGTSGANSVFSTITSGGGGRGGCGGESPNPSSCGPSPQGATPGRSPGNGSGGGGAGGASGDTFPGASGGSFGNNGGGTGGPYACGGSGGAGGGGAGAAGSNNNNVFGGGGGAGDANSITGSPVTRGSGGPGVPRAPGGNGANGAANFGAGGGGAQYPNNNGGTGGSGVVIIRYKYQN
jgi:hypothetical protein|tara:strand:- start:240 stop:1637 length:1398 start_codon:yes stop_codon:yes gene_type:complete